METMEAIRTRRSIRHYRPDPVPLKLLEKLVEAGRWAPTGADRQYWRFIVVDDPKTMKMVKRVSPMMWDDAPAAVFACFDLSRSSLGKDTGKASGECSGFPSQNILLAAHALGLGACAIGGFNRQAIRKILSVPEDMAPLLLITVGYPDEEPVARPRRSWSDVAYLNTCAEKWVRDDE